MSEATMETVGGRIRFWRKQRGFTLDVLGRAIGKNMSTLSRIETDKQSPTADELGALADKLGCTVHDLIPARAARQDKRGSKRAAKRGAEGLKSHARTLRPRRGPATN